MCRSPSFINLDFFINFGIIKSTLKKSCDYDSVVVCRSPSLYHHQFGFFYQHWNNHEYPNSRRSRFARLEDDVAFVFPFGWWRLTSADCAQHGCFRGSSAAYLVFRLPRRKICKRPPMSSKSKPNQTLSVRTLTKYGTNRSSARKSCNTPNRTATAWKPKTSERRKKRINRPTSSQPQVQK